jgi:hypothetical protein
MHIQSFRLLKPAIALFAAAFLLWCMGCAKIADPQPPEILIPKPATDLAARQVSDFILLSVSMPSQNTNGSPVSTRESERRTGIKKPSQNAARSQVSTLQRVDVFRFATSNSLVSNKPLSDAEFLKQALPILSIPSRSFASYLDNDTFLIQDRIQPASGSSFYSKEFQYAVLFVNKKNQAAGLSNRVSIAPIPIPPPPEGFSATVTEHSIRLKWNVPLQNMDGSKPARIAGYIIYRSETKDPLSAAPIASDLLEKAEYEDHSFEFDKTYYYTVWTVVSLQNPRAESLPSEILEVTARDTFPPSSPRDFKVLLEGETIILLWAPSLSSDAAGYKLYRQEKGSPNRQLLQDKLIPSWSFRDKDAAPGKSYEYSVLAVDFHGNESEAAKATLEIP